MEPFLHQLARETGETASFYVREGEIRSCVARVEGPHSVRHSIRIGERLPLSLGAPGRVILAFSGAQGEPYESIRLCGYQISTGEREKEVSSVAAPVFRTNWKLLGSMCISGPSSRLDKSQLALYAAKVVQVANQLSYALAGASSPATPPVISKWHP